MKSIVINRSGLGVKLSPIACTTMAGFTGKPPAFFANPENIDRKDRVLAEVVMRHGQAASAEGNYLVAVFYPDMCEAEAVEQYGREDVFLGLHVQMA